MKKIYFLVISTFIRPFLATFFIVMFVLLMLFLFKYIDDMIGKGLELWVIFQLMLYASATNVSMALPLSVLLSSIMTFGGLGEHYELVAIKSAGVSLQHAMTPLFIVVSILSMAAFLFSDYMLPVANLKYNSLLHDVRNHKAAFLITEGIFNTDIPGYAIRVKKKSSDGQTLRNIRIYEHNQTNNHVNVLIAREATMPKTGKNQPLCLKLKEGVRYEESSGEDLGINNSRHRLMRIRFKETEQQFDLSMFALHRTDEELFKGIDAMLNLKQLRYCRDSVQKQIDSNLTSVYEYLRPYYSYTPPQQRKFRSPEIAPKNAESILRFLPQKNYRPTFEYAQNRIRVLKEELGFKKNFNDESAGYIRGFIAEFHKKFTLSFSCLVLFLIGAPLGAIIRKGGLGMPVVVAILCFLAYHIISTIGEKSVRDSSLSPTMGMWMAIFLLAPVGIFMTYQAARDSVLFDLDNFKKFSKKLFSRGG